MSTLARRQSEPLKAAPATQTERRCFTVIDGNETFGLPVHSVQTIFRIEGVTRVPLGPPEVEGLVNLRGRIVTAVSLKRRLASVPREAAPGALAIGIEHRGESFALIVDEVGDVITCDETARINRPPHMDPMRARLTSDFYRLESGILPILDMDAMFDFAERESGHGSAQLNASIIRSDS
jgi:purine-binding chemotaxis protein CheW